MEKSKYLSPDEALTACAETPDALEYLYVTLYKSVCAVCYACSGSLEETKDAAQETFARLPYLSRKYKRGTNAKAYILKVAQNTAKELYRKARREKSGLPDGAADASPIAKLESEIYVSELLGCLDTFSRCIVVMYVFDRLTFEQIAEATGKHPNTVRKKYKAALEKLKGYV